MRAAYPTYKSVVFANGDLNWRDQANALTESGLIVINAFHTSSRMVADRVIQVIGSPLIFIPISTLNYVGVPQNTNAMSFDDRFLFTVDSVAAFSGVEFV